MVVYDRPIHNHQGVRLWLNNMMTKSQLELAIQMHSDGINWTIIANHFQISTSTLRNKLKHYEQSNNSTTNMELSSTPSGS